MGEVGEAEILGAGKDGGNALDCADGAEIGSVDAAIIRRVCYELRDQVDPRGLWLRKAAVTGRLDLAGLEVPFPLRFEDCNFESPVVLEGAQLYGIALNGCVVPGLLANGVRIRHDLDLSRTHVMGALETSASTSKTAAIWLCESRVGGRLLCVDSVIEGGDRAIQADRIHVAGNVRLLHTFTSVGEVRLIGARIEGSLDLTGAKIDSEPTGLALDLGEAVIDGSVFLVEASGRAPDVRGRIDMGRARIGGQFLIRDARLEAPQAVPVGSKYSRARLAGIALSAPRLSVGAEVTLEGDCQVTGGIDLSMSELSNLSVNSGCALRAPGQTALNLTNAELLSSLTVGAGVTVDGTVRLTGARIHGRLTLDGAVLNAPEGKTLIAAQGAVVDGGVELGELHATGGRLRFSNATLGSVTAVGATLINPAGFTLSLHQATVNGSVVLVGGFTSEGLLSLSRSTIEGRLECAGGSFTCPAPAERNEHGHAIEAISATIRGGMHLDWTAVSPSVDFTNATTSFLIDDPRNWPPTFVISGFSYDRFGQSAAGATAPAWDHARRCAWLSRQAAYDAGPYEQAARVFRRHGYTSGARAILISQRRQARRAATGRLALPRRMLDAAYGATVSYGYRPWRVLWFLAALLILVTVSFQMPGAQAAMRAASAGSIYAAHSRPPAPGPASETATGPHNSAAHKAVAADCSGGQVRCFNSVLYAIDTVVPLVSLGQRSTWYPDAKAPDGTFMQWWLNGATMLGWLLSSIFVLALASFARSV